MNNSVVREAIVLAGGFGTRLRKVVSDVPKPMAPMDDRGTPFLAIVLEQLAKQGVEKVILSVGYMSEVIQNYFGDSYAGMDVVYSHESEPLGTGGAVKKALSLCSRDIVFILNGDTYFDVDLTDLEYKHRESGADFTLAAKEMLHFDRYGELDLAVDDRVIAFREKKYCDYGYINGGIYCIKKTILSNVKQEVFSLERDFLEKKIKSLRIVAYKADGCFVDIGVPEDYYRAKMILKASNSEL